jgi:hypothetical protein
MNTWGSGGRGAVGLEWCVAHEALGLCRLGNSSTRREAQT